MEDFGLLVAQYNATLPTLVDGELTELQVDTNGRLLVQADVTVLVDFLGLNGAADNANILIVGTEDGTSGGTAHAIRVASNGSVVIDDGGNSISVDATDLDIRDLDASQDNVAISDGTDTLEINNDGSINVNAAFAPIGTEQYTVTDALAGGGDGLETITAAATPWITVASYSHTTGTAYVYGYQWACDQNAQVRLVTVAGATTIVYKTAINSSATPGDSEHWGEGGRIEIPGVATQEIRLQIKKRKTPGGNANGTGSVHIRVTA